MSQSTLKAPLMPQANLDKTRRMELILRQIDSLPTLPAVATRLLALTTSDDSNAREVSRMIASDPALTAKVLSICRRADLGIRDEVMTIDKAVVMLGFNTIRNAVLSLQVFELFDELPQRSAGGEELARQDSQKFPRDDFWRHSLAVGVAAELIAEQQPRHAEIKPDEAYVCGLLHDIGKLALHYVLPKSFARVIELAELNQGNIAEFERRIIGMDHHTAGKRLAEQWQLPHRLQDCIWLHGSSYQALPKLEHRRMIGLISLADLLVRRAHLGYSGNFTFKDEVAQLARELDFDPQQVESILPRLHECVQERAAWLGLHEQPSREMFWQSIQQANQVLGRLNAALERKAAVTVRQAQMLDAIVAFHSQATPGRTVQDVLDAVIASSHATMGPGFYALLYQAQAVDGQLSWLVCQYDANAKLMRSQLVEPPPFAGDLTRLEPNQPMTFHLMGLMPWLSDYLVQAPDLRMVQVLPLTCGWGTVALMLHDRAQLPGMQHLSALTTTWGAAIAAAAQHEGARRLGEDLAQANRALAEAQDRLLQTESMARLGEMAAGAAHEMNNPLAVISGRSQLLAMTLPAGSKEQKAASTMMEQANRLSDLITSLRMFADPPKPQRRMVHIGQVLDESIKRMRMELPSDEQNTPISVQLKDPLPPVWIDPQQIGQAVCELVRNALQASPRSSVHVLARVEPLEKNVMIQVSDDGGGMDAYTLSHAMDPFFSSKSAGRRVGMGLPRAQQWVHAHGGKLELRSEAGVGTTVTLWVPGAESK